MPRKRTVQTENSGILSGVFSLLSREFDSFVASATGSSSNGPSTSRVSLEDESEEYDSDSQEADQDILHEGWDEPSAPRPRVRDSRKARHASPSPNHRQRATSRKPAVQSPPEEAIQLDEDIRSEGSRHSPSPPPLPRTLKRRPSFTMPGSLFIRSPSLEPDVRARQRDRRQRVRFSSRNPSPPSVASNTRSSASPPLKDASTNSPRRHSHIAPSVESTVDKFHDEDAGPSILLPNPKKSPHALGKVQYIDTIQPAFDLSPSYTRKDKGKARALDSSPMDDSETSGVLRVEGKERELVAAREELDRNQRRHEANRDGSVDQAETDRDADKARIRELEREIQRLKEELLRRPTSYSGGPPPPPPPPPPPFPFPKKNLISISSDADPHNLFASARASLKQAPTPVENPIVPVRKVGVSSMGIPPEKMAAFLNEMKTVRLRKTSERTGASGGNASFSGSMPTTNNSFTLPPRRQSFSSLHRPQIHDNSIASTSSTSRSARPATASTSSNVLTGEKRKRTISEYQDDTSGPSKRHSGISSAESSFASGSASSRTLPAGVSIPSFISRPILSVKQFQTNTTASVSNTASRKSVHSKQRQTPSITSAPTPSLCSDNEIEREEETSLDDRPPSTPPVDEGLSLGGGGPSRAFFRFRGNGIPVVGNEANRSRGVKDAHAHSHTADVHEDEGDDEDADEDVEMDEDILPSSLQRAPAPAPIRTAPVRTPTPQESRSDSARRGAGTQKQQQQQQPKSKSKSNVFAKRPPSTPFPNKSPRRPRPPTHSNSNSNHRTTRRVPIPSRRHDDDDNISDGENRRGVEREEADEDPLSLSFSSPENMYPPYPPVPTPDPPTRLASSSDHEASSRRTLGKIAKAGKTRTETRRPGSSRAKKAPEPVQEFEHEHEHEHDFEAPSSPSIRPHRARSNSRSSVNTAASVSRQPPPPPSPPPPQPPQPQPQSQSQRSISRFRSDSRSSRRLTLDEELRNAAIPFSRDLDLDREEMGGDGAHEDHDRHSGEEFKSGVFSSVGTRSKRLGFLAHGGAGGAPVFMGVGYVDGAEEEEHERDEQDGHRSGGGDHTHDEHEHDEAENPFDFEPAEPEYAEKDALEGEGGEDDDDEYIPPPIRAPAKIKMKPKAFVSKIPRRR